MTRTIVVTSGKGGVGKTTLTAFLGRMLATLGYKVLLIDTDMGLNNLDIALNIENRVVFDIQDVLEGKCRLKQAIIEDKIPGLFAVPSARGYTNNDITEKLKKLVETLVGFDFCLVDCPAGIEIGFHRAVSACSEAIVIATPHLSSLRDAEKTIAILQSYGKRPYLVLNRARGDLIAGGDMISSDMVKEIIKIPLIGVIPEDDAVGISSNSGELLPRSNEGYKAVLLLTKNLIYNTENIYDVSKKYRGFFGMFKRNMMRRK